MAELGSDTYAYSQVGYNYDGQVVSGDPAMALAASAAAATATASAGGQSEGQPQMELSQQYSANSEAQQDQNSGYYPNTDEDAFIPPPELSIPQGMVVVSLST